MTITLLPLPSGRCSLEFAPSDLSSVALAIERLYGVPDTKLHPASAEYCFGGCSFIFQNEWDDPCLISCAAEGTIVLENLYAALTP
ncbi:hypothetical protein GAO09_05545 [Rhizobiales bacterium RZME27]|uniref:Uncharacterized protein n=1 Tax=Endobacterium cereale TaxID=2663029 RepID=A0A6A8A8F9_9HYPH|nr:hypothetical protein [Endobacterium cereale]MEB2843600.1 hypothetical protein [Endobacterium cereale]MQY45526.1 hypothetical protein [Endobacterium cereale]